MDPSQSSGGGASQGTFPGPNNSAFQGQWNPYMFAYQPPPPRGWVPQTFQSYGANVGMMTPSSYGPEGFQQTQPTEAYVHNAEADVQEVPPPTAARKKKSATRVKLSNFNPDEDKNLVKSWLEVSCDPITSTGQKKDRMWQRILERYETRRGNKPPRTVRSLQSHWDTIRAECNVFAGHYANSIRENPSGMSDADKTTHAVGNFSDIEERKFIYLHCWELLKDAPKWQDGSSRDHITTARGEGFGEDTVEDVGGQPSSLPSAAAARRPMGRDAAKAAKKKANSDAGSSSSAEYAAKLQDLSLQKQKFNEDESALRTERWQRLACIEEKRFEETRRNNEVRNKIEQDRLQLLREQQEFQMKEKQREEDERILKIDLDTCPPKLQEYYKMCQDEILVRKAASCRRRE